MIKNFTAFNPTRLHFGRDCIQSIGEDARQYGKRVLLVYGKGSVKKYGYFDQVKARMEEARLEIVEYGGIKPNPIVEDVERATELGRKEKVDLVLALGGGSVIDSAKIMALCISTGHKAWDIMTWQSMPDSCLPLMAVLTLAATGTEMNGAAVVQNHLTQVLQTGAGIQEFKIRGRENPCGNVGSDEDCEVEGEPYHGGVACRSGQGGCGEDQDGGKHDDNQTHGQDPGQGIEDPRGVVRILGQGKVRDHEEQARKETHTRQEKGDDHELAQKIIGEQDGLGEVYLQGTALDIPRHQRATGEEVHGHDAEELIPQEESIVELPLVQEDGHDLTTWRALR